MTPFETFSERLRHVAGINKKVQADLSKDLGKDRATVTRWWNGGVAPSQRNMRMIADYFGCDVNWLASGEGSPFPDEAAGEGYLGRINSGMVEHQTPKPEPIRMEVKNEAELTNTDMLLMTSKVLESNTVYRSALASNIRAFYQAVLGEDDMNDMRNEINMMRKELAEMKELIMSLKSSEEPEKKRAVNGH